MKQESAPGTVQVGAPRVAHGTLVGNEKDALPDKATETDAALNSPGVAPDSDGTPGAKATVDLARGPGRGRAGMRPDVPGITVVHAGSRGSEASANPRDPAVPGVVQAARSGLAQAMVDRARAEIFEMRTTSLSHLETHPVHEVPSQEVRSSTPPVAADKSPANPGADPGESGNAFREGSGAAANPGAGKWDAAQAAASKSDAGAEGTRAASPQGSPQGSDGSRGALNIPAHAPQGLEAHSAPRILEQLVSQIHVSKLGEGTSRATVRLNPESLGQVEIRLEMEGGHLRAHFSAANADVREAIRQHLPELQRALAENKISLSSLQVEVGRGSEGRHESSMGGRQARMKRALQGPAPAGPTDSSPRTESGLDLYA